MNINNNFSLYTNFCSNTTRSKSTQDMDESALNTHQFLDKCCNRLLEREREVPENGKFKPLSIAFDIPQTRNEASLKIDYDASNPKDGRILKLGVRRNGTSRLVSNHILYGTKKEIMDYLKKPDIDELEKYVQELSQSVDEYYDD